MTFEDGSVQEGRLLEAISGGSTEIVYCPHPHACSRSGRMERVARSLQEIVRLERWTRSATRMGNIVGGVVGAVLLGGLVAAGILWWQVFSGPSGMLHVYFFDVGQGDSALIVTPRGRQVLVDGGPNSESAVEAVGGELAFGDKSLDLVVLTHLDADHSRGLMEVLDRYRVGGVLIGSDDVDAPLGPEWDAALERGGLAPVKVEYGYRIDLEPGSTPAVILEVLNPQREQVRPPRADLNNNAVVLRLVYGKTSFLLASDVEAKAEGAMSRGGTTLDSDVLKVAHHGSKTSTTDVFLQRVDPEIAVISVGSGNPYGHPHPGVLA
ncbi:MAG: MBL fold metallo-hydrolase, partial [Gemmatimonadetes bacterium]|nr:MBL fold metallo-hydrolase [Gemmatimonadota bacterium]